MQPDKLNLTGKPVIIIMPVGRDGSSYYRVTQPYVRMHELGLATVIAPKHTELDTKEFWEAIKKCNYIVVRMEHREFVLDWLDKNVPNKKIVLDLDDNIWDVNPYAQIYAFHGTHEVMHGDKFLWKDGEGDFNIRRNKRRLLRDEELLRRADIVTVSTPRLADKIKQFNKNVYVVYNGLNFDNWKPVNINKTDEFRIGWAGGATHYVDLIPLKEDLKYLMNKYKNIKFVIAGMNFEGLTKELPAGRVEILPWVDCEAHPFRTVLMNLDLAIIPLVNNAFNICKSCIKYYEFAAVKVPVLASKVPPYSDELFSENLTTDFRASVEQIINNRGQGKQEAITDNCYNWVRENRDINKIVFSLYEYLSGAKIL